MGEKPSLAVFLGAHAACRSGTGKWATRQTHGEESITRVSRKGVNFRGMPGNESKSRYISIKDPAWGMYRESGVNEKVGRPPERQFVGTFLGGKGDPG